MITFHQSLPFSTPEFFKFMAVVFFILLIVKTILKRFLPFKWFITSTSLLYIAAFYPKPIQLTLLIVYLYIVYALLKKYYKSDNIIIPMVLMSLPMILMKFVNTYPPDNTDKWVHLSKTIIQIAGLSYIVFKVIGLYIDERRSEKLVSFVDFFNFSTFVPTLLIGPIDRFKRFQNDINKGYDNISGEMYQKGFNNLIRGLLYKYIIAEVIRRFIMIHIIDDGSVLFHIYSMYTYIFYLFFDFAGYSYLAISFGNFLGVDVPINFNKPFLAVNPKEFWQRWHKTLGDWLNDYFFKPIFKHLTSKKVFNSIQRQSIALFLTFSLMGAWNGFELHYIISGMLFGIYSMIHNYYAYQCKKKGKDVFFGTLSPLTVRYLSIFFMFNLVTFAIYIFSGKFI